jgi:CheY-like chemotaxis protein
MARSVLVIEDDCDTGQFITWTLSAVGIRAILVHSRDDAFFHLRTSSFDTILMDYAMPGLNPEEFMETVRVNFPSSKVVLITASWRAEALAEALRTDGFVTKPFDPKQLQQKMSAS